MAVWLALAVFLVGTGGGLVYAVVRALRTWRQLKRTKSSFSAELNWIAATTGEISAQLERAGASNVQLGAAGERLQTSRAFLDVQLAAVREARSALSRTFWFLPGR